MRCPTLKELPPPPPGKTGWPWTEESRQLPDRMPDGSTWPRISIVTPSLNQGRFIEETIRSVLLQGYPNVEYIIIDGGSEDQSVAMIRGYERWIKYWISQRDKGQADAINKGFKKASGILFAYVNSDDSYVANALSKIALTFNRFNKPRYAFICGSVQYWDGIAFGEIYYNQDFGTIERWIDGYVPLCQPGCFWTKSLWEKNGPFPINCHFMFDAFFFARSCHWRTRFLHVRQIIAKFRLHPNSKTYKFAIIENQFWTEWINIKPYLVSKLSLFQRVQLVYYRGKSRNWAIISDALNVSDGYKGEKSFWLRLRGNPFWLLDRPMAAAAVRLIFRRLKSAQGIKNQK